MSGSNGIKTQRQRPSALVLGLMVLLVGTGVFCAVALYISALEGRTAHAATIHEQLTPAGTLRPTAEVVEAVRQLKLVTVEVHSRVSTTVSHESWRGDVSARVEAPVKLLYGADLSKLESEAVAFSPASHSWAVRLPTPSRIATEVATGEEDVDVQVGWLRLRSRAGEYYLGLARRDLNERARELILSPHDAAMVREVTRTQVDALLRRILGHDADIAILFDDGEIR